MAQTVWQQGGYMISTDKHLLDLSVIHDYLCNESYWATGIPLQILQKSIDNSFCFGIYEGTTEREAAGGEGCSAGHGDGTGGAALPDGADAARRQIGFARVVTDYATFAWLADVFILPEFRGRGLSKWLVQTIVEHPELQMLRRFMLATHDAHGLYSQYGFTPLEHPERFLGIARGISVYNTRS